MPESIIDVLSRCHVEVLVWMLRKAEIGFGIHRIGDTRRNPVLGRWCLRLLPLRLALRRCHTHLLRWCRMLALNVIAHLRGEIEALLQSHRVSPLGRILHLLVLLLIVLCFSSRSVGLRKLFRRLVLIPSPFLLELLVNESNAPASLFVYSVKDGEDLLLLFAISQTFGSMCERADSYGCDTTMSPLVNAL